MDSTEYAASVLEIKNEAKNKLNALAKEYAISNSSVKVGDVVQDHIGSVSVEKITIYRSNPPSCIYYGLELTARGVPRKGKRTRMVYQVNLLKEKV